ncbi:unnamed protein product [Protopolystoma xenopodis]|uniref:Uncharacterized protein n=1 Tax=Protopolystoma xenopodis TaxID=117903 RepID=A0A3S4ZVZ4_9PLAT|nr:unnamed protein product [Protopolystoma xenopodis]
MTVSITIKDGRRSRHEVVTRGDPKCSRSHSPSRGGVNVSTSLASGWLFLGCQALVNVFQERGAEPMIRADALHCLKGLQPTQRDMCRVVEAVMLLPRNPFIIASHLACPTSATSSWFRPTIEPERGGINKFL